MVGRGCEVPGATHGRPRGNANGPGITPGPFPCAHDRAIFARVGDNASVTLPSETFGHWLKQEFARREWRPGDLARCIEASDPTRTVSHRANNIRIPSCAAVGRIATASGADVDYLLTVAGHRPPDPDFNPTCAEPHQLLPLVQSIDWSKHGRELALIRRQLEFIAGVDRREHDRD